MNTLVASDANPATMIAQLRRLRMNSCTSNGAHVQELAALHRLIRDFLLDPIVQRLSAMATATRMQLRRSMTFGSRTIPESPWRHGRRVARRLSTFASSSGAPQAKDEFARARLLPNDIQQSAIAHSGDAFGLLEWSMGEGQVNCPTAVT